MVFGAVEVQSYKTYTGNEHIHRCRHNTVLCIDNSISLALAYEQFILVHYPVLKEKEYTVNKRYLLCQRGLHHNINLVN